MTALAANRQVNIFQDQELRELPVAAAVRIYKDSFVGIHPALGYAKPFEPCDCFAGIAYEEANNSSGAAGAISVQVRTVGDFEHALTGVAQADEGKSVFATDDGTLALAGHYDGYVGKVLAKLSTNVALVRLKSAGEKPTPVCPCKIAETDFTGVLPPTGAVAGPTYFGPFQLDSALGLGVLNGTGIDPYAQLEFDAVAEIASAAISTKIAFDSSKGMKFEADIHMTNIGDNVALDVDFGFVNVYDGTVRANIDDASLTRHALFHMDGASSSILLQSDDDSTDVAPVDTTLDNVTTAGAYKNFILIVRPTGLVEGYIDGVRVLSGTVFGIGSTAAAFAAIVNVEKTSDDTVAILRCSKLRVTGG